jgi:hypothetical protein
MKGPRVRLRTILIVIAFCALTFGIVTQTQRARIREERQRAELAQAIAQGLQYQAEVALRQAENEDLKAQVRSLEDGTTREKNLKHAAKPPADPR